MAKTKNLNDYLKDYTGTDRMRLPGEVQIDFNKDGSIKSKTTDIQTYKYKKPVGKLETLKFVPSVVGDALKKIPKPSRHSDKYNYQQQQQKKKNK